MRVLSVCSGIEAASVAWHPLGWQTIAVAEIEKFPSAVLAHHYPDVPNLGDLTRYREWPDALRPDLIVGGTPCQSFSVAGLRKGLDDPRGNLALVFLGLVDRYRPRWVVWENVPGVRSSGRGRDFGAFLGALGELGYGWAYRSLDAQYFGLAQRRERVFVVGCLGDWRAPAAVLLEPEGLRGHPAPRREAREVAPTIPARSSSGGGLGTDFDCDGGAIPIVSPALLARDYKGPSSDGDGAPLIPVTHALRAEGFDASEDGTGRGTPIVPVIDKRTIACAPVAPAVTSAGPPFSRTGNERVETEAIVAFGWQNSPAQGASVGDTEPTLDKSKHPAVAFSDTAPTLDVRAGRSGETTFHTSGGLVGAPMAVRRLTPRECSRLQGFPDDYLELDKDADAEEARSRAVLRRVWVAAHQEANGVQGCLGELAALLSPQVLLAGVFRGWIPWSVAEWGVAGRGPVSRQNTWPEASLRPLRHLAESGSSPYRREPIEQCARELGGPLSFLSHEGAPYASDLFATIVRQSPSAERVLRQARAEVEEVWRSTGRGWQAGKRVADGPRYKALGNSMAVPVMRWIGERIARVDALEAERLMERAA